MTHKHTSVSLARVFARSMNFWSPRAKHKLAALCGCVTNDIQPIDDSVMTISIEAVGSGCVIIPAVAINDNFTFGQLKELIFEKDVQYRGNIIKLYSGHGGEELRENDLTPVSKSCVVNGTIITVVALSTKDVLTTVYTKFGASKWILTHLSGALYDNYGACVTLNMALYTLRGTISSKIGNFTTLQNLILGNNGLSRTIPTEIGNLSNLRKLDLRQNKLSGKIPTEIGNLSNLTDLVLSNNKLSGNIPTEIGNFLNLQNLEFERNALTGNIPTEIGHLSNLRYLTLCNNTLSGNIPTEIGNLPNLSTLILYNNILSGNVPTEIINLAKLKFFFGCSE